MPGGPAGGVRLLFPSTLHSVHTLQPTFLFDRSGQLQKLATSTSAYLYKGVFGVL